MDMDHIHFLYLHYLLAMAPCIVLPDHCSTAPDIMSVFSFSGHASVAAGVKHTHRVLGSQHAVATAKYPRAEPTSTFSRSRCAGRRPLYTLSAPFEPPCTFVSPRSTV